jgi:hypothetical protein
LERDNRKKSGESDKQETSLDDDDVDYFDVLGRILLWMSNHGSSDLVAIINADDIIWVKYTLNPFEKKNNFSILKIIVNNEEPV